MNVELQDTHVWKRVLSRNEKSRVSRNERSSERIPTTSRGHKICSVCSSVAKLRFDKVTVAGSNLEDRYPYSPVLDGISPVTRGPLQINPNPAYLPDLPH